MIKILAQFTIKALKVQTNLFEGTKHRATQETSSCQFTMLILIPGSHILKLFRGFVQGFQLPNLQTLR